jgi:hypothetical protein
LGQDLLSGRAVGPYRILELASEDALGPVYVAEHPRLGARVAVKVLAREPAFPPDAIERCFRETRAVNAIRHERIIDVLDLGTLNDGCPFVVMAHLEGATLARLLEVRGPLPDAAGALPPGEPLLVPSLPPAVLRGRSSERRSPARLVLLALSALAALATLAGLSALIALR